MEYWTLGKNDTAVLINDTAVNVNEFYTILRKSGKF